MTNLNNIIIAVCLFVSACSLGYAYYITTHKANLTDTSTKNYVQAEATIISKKVDKNGVEHTIVEETNNVLPKNLVQSEGLYDAEFVDSLISQTDIQKKEITSLTQINQTISAKNKQAVAVVDSFQQRKFEYTDKNLYVSYTPVRGDTAAAGKFDYRYNQNLNVIEYNRKKWLLGQDRYYSDISSNDVNSTINGMKILSVKQHDRVFGVTLSAKSVYLPGTGKLGAGAQLRVSLNRFTATGSNLYFPQSQKWIPVVGIEYDLLHY